MGASQGVDDERLAAVVAGLHRRERDVVAVVQARDERRRGRLRELGDHDGDVELVADPQRVGRAPRASASRR